MSLIHGTSQVARELIPIKRHLMEYKIDGKKASVSVFLAPVIHSDSLEFAKFSKYKDHVCISEISIDYFENVIQNKYTFDKFYNM